MSDTMSQEMIDAMLRGELPAEGGETPEETDLSAENIPDIETGDMVASSGMQSESVDESLPSEPRVYDLPPDIFLTEQETDILGEVGNMCMGASATALYTYVGKTVNITTPKVTIYPTMRDLLEEFTMPFIVVEVGYVEGVEGRNVLMLRKKDAAIITDLMMGGEGVVEGEFELDELHLSAISEIMNQMIGSSATSLAKLLQTPVNISPPKTHVMDFNQNGGPDFLGDTEAIIRINFSMEIEGVLTSDLMQIMTFSFAKQLVQMMLTTQQKELASAPVTAATQQSEPEPVPVPVVDRPAPAPTAPVAAQQPPHVQYERPQYEQPQAPRQTVDVQPMQYANFSVAPSHVQEYAPQNLDLIMDVTMQVTVELGKTKKTIREVLDLGLGSIIELEKMAGEPVEVLVNGKLIARGEVVVIHESYGVRITDIVSPANRIK